MSAIKFSIEEGIITKYQADVLALKYAQNFYGADAAVASSLTLAGIPDSDLRPSPDGYRYITTRNSIKAEHTLFVATPDLIDFDYTAIRLFAQKVLAILEQEAPHMRHLAMTVHGVGFGLDETEALLAQFAGYVDAFHNKQFPRGLNRISIVSNNFKQVTRLRRVVENNLAGTALTDVSNIRPYSLIIPTTADFPGTSIVSTKAFESAGKASLVKPHIFVAMPFAEDFLDTFHFGIQQTVHEAGYLCERVDEESFTGGIVDQVKKKIETASVVIAELSGANPNVYLEVGYAWGKGLPTILLIKNEQNLGFDVRDQRCLKYRNIMHLKELLARELSGLKEKKLIS